MSFGTLTAQTLNYEERSEGEYHLSTNTFADPADYLRIRAGAVRKDGAMSFGATRILEKDVTAGGDTTRKGGSVSLNVVIPPDGSFSATEIDSLLQDLHEILTSANISQILQGRK